MQRMAGLETSTTMAAPVLPNKNDVLFGRGTAINNHAGNVRFRTIVDLQKDNFAREKVRKEKRAIAKNLMDTIYGLDPPGRFLEENRSQRTTNDSDKSREGVDDADDACDSSNVRGYDGGHESGLHPKILSKTWVCVDPDRALSKIMQRLREKDMPCPQSADAAVSSCGQVANASSRAGSDCSSAEGDSNPANMKSPPEPEPAVSSVTPIISVQQDPPSSGANVSQMAEGLSWIDPLPTGKDCEIVDEEVDTFLRDFNSEFGDVKSSEVQEFTLNGWMEHMMMKLGGPGISPGYIRSALPIALKLTECLIKAEEDEQNGLKNPISLSSIATANVLIQVSGGGGQGEESIVHVAVTDCGGEASNVASRLFALGTLLYDLFSVGKLCHEGISVDACLNQPSIVASMESVGFGNDPPSEPTAKKPSSSVYNTSGFSANLEAMGVPLSLCAIVNDLLDCCNSEFKGNEAYESFAELRIDLGLMINDPSRFLDGIDPNPSQPISLPNKLYGREADTTRLRGAYQRWIGGECRGVIIKGGAGVGKTALALQTQELTQQINGYFATAKFDQNINAASPLSTIGTLLNTLCDLFVQDALPAQVRSIEETLKSSFANQAGLIASVVPSLRKLMPSYCINDVTSSASVNSAAAMRYLFGKLVSALTSYGRPIAIYVDNIQWADSSSVFLILALISDASSRSSVFYTFSYRDGGDRSEPFNLWLQSVSMLSLEVIELADLTPDGVNSLLSETLHLCPRITRRLASALHLKTRGNPLFLRQLILSLRKQGDIWVNLGRRRWCWDLQKITNMEISDDLLILLMKEMKDLPVNLLLGLQVASCWGSCIKYSIASIISKELNIDLVNVLKQVSNRGFMIDISEKSLFRFTHDKIEQAAYEIMPEQQRREYHMRFGLALFANRLSDQPENEELFFAAINQTNSGGPSVVYKPGKRAIIAGLNLEAGRRAIKLSDYRSAYRLFGHGISFLEEGHWNNHYKLSLNLYNAAADAACRINNRDAVTIYSKEVIANARCYDDKLNCLCSATQALQNAELLSEAMDSTFSILANVGEGPLMPLGDAKLMSGINLMNHALENTTDDFILNMKMAMSEKDAILLKLYSSLILLLQYLNPSLKEAVSLRMLEITMNSGLTTASPHVFASYGELLINTGEFAKGCRLGRLALKLIQKKDFMASASLVMFYVNATVLWTSDPLHSVAEGFLIGKKAGEQSGDFYYSSLNWHLSAVYGYVAGFTLNSVRENIAGYIKEMSCIENQQAVKGFVLLSILLHSLVASLIEGDHVIQQESIGDIPTEKALAAAFAEASRNPMLILLSKIFALIRAYFFKQPDEIIANVDISETIAKYKQQLNAMYVFGMFFEGLSSFFLARKFPNDKMMWVQKGESVLARIRVLVKHSSWNWESKVLLLEAERQRTLNMDGAANYYAKAIRSSRDHKFVHEEAISSELAGNYFHEMQQLRKSFQLLSHAGKKYEKWGAVVVAGRLKTVMDFEFRSNPTLSALAGAGDDSLEYMLAVGRSSSNKRQEAG